MNINLVYVLLAMRGLLLSICSTSLLGVVEVCAPSLWSRFLGERVVVDLET